MNWPAPSRRGVEKLLEWLRACETLGWKREYMPALTDLFWKYKDRNGNLKRHRRSSSAGEAQ